MKKLLKSIVYIIITTVVMIVTSYISYENRGPSIEGDMINMGFPIPYLSTSCGIGSCISFPILIIDFVITFAVIVIIAKILKKVLRKN